MINSRKKEDLHPAIQRGFDELVKRLNKINPIWKPALTCTFRDKEAQENEVKKGTSRAKWKQSFHNYLPSYAFDLHNNQSNNLYPTGFLETAGRIWTEMGGEWGGSWRGFQDKPHFQFSGNLTITDLIHGKTLPLNTKMKWENEIKEAIKIEEMQYMIRETKILLNGQEETVTAILDKDTNYIRLRDLEKLGFKVAYDEVKKMPVVNKQ